MILAQVWEAIFAQTSTGHSIFSRAFQAQILLGCEASVPQLSKLVHNLHIHAKMGALRTKFKVKIYHGDWDQIFHTFKKWTFWHPLTQKLVKMVMPQYIEGGFMLFSKIHDSHSTTSDQISWLHSQEDIIWLMFVMPKLESGIEHLMTISKVRLNLCLIVGIYFCLKRFS